MSANERQVGGDHYKTKYEHWDFVEDIGLGYLESVAIKYIARWRKKNGVEDLQKADHYIEKLIQTGRSNKVNQDVVCAALDRFLDTIPDMRDATLVVLIVEWETTITDLLTARDLIKELIITAQTPMEDSNRHAR